MTRLLNFTRTQERRIGSFCVLEWKRGGGWEVYIVAVEKIWMECHLMKVDKGSKRIMNLNLILDFGKILCIKCRDWWEWGASKIRFSCNYCNSLQSQIQKIISYLILIGIILFLCSNWGFGCLVSGKINLIHKFKIFWEIFICFYTPIKHKLFNLIN